MHIFTLVIHYLSKNKSNSFLNPSIIFMINFSFPKCEEGKIISYICYCHFYKHSLKSSVYFCIVTIYMYYSIYVCIIGKWQNVSYIYLHEIYLILTSIYLIFTLSKKKFICLILEIFFMKFLTTKKSVFNK